MSFDTRALAEDKKQKTFPESITGENLYFENLKKPTRQQSDHPEKCKTRRFLICSDDNHLLLESTPITVIQDLVPLTEVNISPKISISAQPLKMALHRNPAMHGSRMVIFLHDSKKALFKHD